MTVVSKLKNLCLALVLACLPFTAQAADAPQVPGSVQQMQLSFAPLVKKTSPAVVNIYAKRVVQQQASPFFNDPFFSQFFGMQGMPGMGGGTRTENSLGSGVIVDAAGKIATNTHVIANAVEIIVVTQDGHEYAAKKELVDEKADLAVLSIDPKGAKLPVLELADSDSLEVGDLVLAIGNPFGVGQTVTSGIISGLARTGMGRDYGYFIQTDAAINPGNSGGALIDMKGRLVGINSMIFSQSGGSVGLGFAIPSNMLRTVVDAAHHGNKLVRPWSGITGQAVQPDMVESLGLSTAQGTLITAVNPKGPGARAGLKPGDVILSVNGRVVASPEALKYLLATQTLNSTVKIAVFRKGQAIEAELPIEAPPENPARDTALIQGMNPFSGAKVENISPAVAEELDGLRRDAGVVVVDVVQGNAARLGLRTGDIILSINGEEVTSVSQFKSLLKQLPDSWAVQIMRGNDVINVRVRI